MRLDSLVISLLFICCISYGNESVSKEFVSKHYESRRIYDKPITRNKAVMAVMCCMDGVTQNENLVDVITINMKLDKGESVKVFDWNSPDFKFKKYTCEKSECKYVHVYQIEDSLPLNDGLYARFYCGDNENDLDIEPGNIVIPIFTTPGTSLDVKDIEKTDGRQLPACTSNIADKGEDGASQNGKKNKPNRPD